MTDAYKCDKCGEYKQGQPAFSGEKTIIAFAENGKYDLCPPCWGKVREFIDADKSDRLANAEPEQAPEDTPKDENGDPVFPEVEE